MLSDSASICLTHFRTIYYPSPHSLQVSRETDERMGENTRWSANDRMTCLCFTSNIVNFTSSLRAAASRRSNNHYNFLYLEEISFLPPIIHLEWPQCSWSRVVLFHCQKSIQWENYRGHHRHMTSIVSSCQNFCEIIHLSHSLCDFCPQIRPFPPFSAILVLHSHQFGLFP